MRRPSSFTAEKIAISYDHAALSASATPKIYQATGLFQVTAVRYINPTGLALDNTNTFSLQIKNGSSVVAAVFNTDGDDVPAGVALAANTFVSGVLGAAALLVLAAGDVLSADFVKEGTQTLPAGRLIIEGRYL